MPLLNGTDGEPMNKKCCKQCVKQVMEAQINYGWGKKVRLQRHKEAFSEWFDGLWRKCRGKAPCRFLRMVDGETGSQIIKDEYYPPAVHVYYYVKRTIPPESCPYITEHTVSK
jgi:hypothetical protein